VVVRRRAFNVDCDGIKASAFYIKSLRINSNLPVACAYLPIGRPAGRQGRQACCTVVFAQPVTVAPIIF